jgi:ubiquinone/menaquinone biosynthesis C-methylase UbiE
MRSTDIRQVAIDHHHLVAHEFEKAYVALAQSRFTNAFTYGRAKIDDMVDELFSSLPKGGSILDVGCGTGEHLKRAQRHGLLATGIEPAPAMLGAARRNVPEARLESGIASSLPFEDASFDAVLMIEVLRYLESSDIQLALKEARRVLKPGGTLFVTLVNRWALDGWYVHQRLRQWRKGKEYSNSNPFCEFFTPGSAEHALKAAGFAHARTEGRLLAPLRIVYKMSGKLGTKMAEKLERIDDGMHRWGWTKRFAGHLIAIGKVAT